MERREMLHTLKMTVRKGGSALKVKVIMIPFRDLKLISIKDTIGQAIRQIDDHNMMSLPVVDGRRFIGVLSKQHIYETYFKDYEGSKEEYKDCRVDMLMKTKIEGISENMPIEEAAAMFIKTKFRFIPVIDEDGGLTGIVTQQAIFKEYQKLFGTSYRTFTIYSFDYKGTLAKITELIARAGGNIKNIVLINTETLGLQEIFFRVETDDFAGVIKMLQKKGFDVRIPDKD